MAIGLARGWRLASIPQRFLSAPSTEIDQRTRTASRSSRQANCTSVDYHANVQFLRPSSGNQIREESLRSIVLQSGRNRPHSLGDPLHVYVYGKGIDVQTVHEDAQSRFRTHSREAADEVERALLFERSEEFRGTSSAGRDQGAGRFTDLRSALSRQATGPDASANVANGSIRKVGEFRKRGPKISVRRTVLGICRLGREQDVEDLFHGVAEVPQVGNAVRFHQAVGDERKCRGPRRSPSGAFAQKPSRGGHCDPR